MRIKIRNLGVLKYADFELGDFTILCGGNNTGKTYATYALFGFLHLWHEMFHIEIEPQKIHQLFFEGAVSINANEYAEQAASIVANGCLKYTQQLPRVFAAQADKFKEADFQVILDTFNISKLFAQAGFQQTLQARNAELFTIFKGQDSAELIISLLVKKERFKVPQEVIVKIISDAMEDMIFGRYFPRPFIASAERTGAAIFRKELNFARNRLLEEISQANSKVDFMDLLFKTYQDYALPVEKNVDFTRQLESLAKKRSFIFEKYPEILVDFSDIIGGEYTVTRNDELYYVPSGRRVKLTMDESSSAVRSLLDIGFYLKHMAMPGDLLMVDEPELNLHPENQRRVARLFSRLANIGVKIFITTHSDYIIKELNTLIMLNQDKPYLRQIAEQEGYKSEELIAADRVKVYIAEEALVKLDGGQRKTKCQTLTPANIDPVMGIEARSFDTTIATMNRIQEEIVWGEE